MKIKQFFLLSMAFYILFEIKLVSAFFIPSAIQILGASLSNIISYIIVILSVFFISCFGIIKTHLKKKKVILGIFAIILLFTSPFFMYNEYTKLTTYNLRSTTYEGLRGLQSYELALNSFSSAGEYAYINLTFSFFKYFEDFEAKEEFTFIHYGDNISPESAKNKIVPMLETMMLSERICVSGEISGNDIDECSINCLDEGLGNCFYLYVMDIFNRLLTDGINMDFDINNVTPEEISKYTIITSHIPNETISDFTTLTVDNTIWVDAFRNIEYFDYLLRQHSDEKIIFMCYAGHSSNIMANMANLLGYDAVNVAFQDITNEEIINLENLQEVNRQSSIIINDYSNRRWFRDSLYFDIEGVRDNIRYDENIETINAEFKNGTLSVADINIDNLKNSNIVCGTLLSCKFIQYWISDLGLASEINMIYLYG